MFLCFLLLSLFFGFLSFSDVHAVSDITVHYNSGHTFSWNDPIFPDCSYSDCIPQYNFIIISPDSTSLSTNYIGFRMSPSNRAGDFRCYQYNSSCIFALPDPYDGILGWRGSSTTVPFGFSATLSESLPSPGFTEPSGTLSITSNGTYDVTDYSSAVVDVEQVISETPYDAKFDELISAIYVCAAVLLVLYFFYCLYRLIIKVTGS